MRNNDQMELGLAGGRGVQPGRRRRQRVNRAQWWFAQQRQAVDRATTWQAPALPTRAEQAWLAPRREDLRLMPEHQVCE
ncbi:MAG TPA: hypothetical protein VL527_07180 [Dongiaceae bacterium]|nr:hypothetical protein [Dongiaceae bacterium]